jgi:GYF domain 2
MGASKLWYVKSGRTVQGPISSAELMQMARAGAITPETSVAQSETGPWRPARLVKGLFRDVPPPPEAVTAPEPENPFLFLGREPSAARVEPVAFESAAPEPAAAEEPEEAESRGLALPAMPPNVFARFKRPQEQYPQYSALVAYGWLFRILAVCCLAGAAVALLGGLFYALFQEGTEAKIAALVSAGMVTLGLAFTGFLLLIPGDAILAFVDLVQDARRQRIASERANVLLDCLLTDFREMCHQQEGSPEEEPRGAGVLSPR